MPIYVAHFVVLQQDLWYAADASHEVTRTSEARRIESHLFEADDASHAYLKASKMISSLSDAHCDGDGDVTEFFGLGLYDLEEVFLAARSLDEELRGPYGVEVGGIRWSQAEPEIRLREQLSIFAREGA